MRGLNYRWETLAVRLLCHFRAGSRVLRLLIRFNSSQFRNLQNQDRHTKSTDDLNWILHSWNFLPLRSLQLTFGKLPYKVNRWRCTERLTGEPIARRRADDENPTKFTWLSIIFSLLILSSLLDSLRTASKFRRPLRCSRGDCYWLPVRMPELNFNERRERLTVWMKDWRTNLVLFCSLIFQTTDTDP